MKPSSTPPARKRATVRSTRKSGAPAKKAFGAVTKRDDFKKAPAAAPKQSEPRAEVRATIVAGGFKVFSTPLRPRHFTREQIAQAVAELD